MIVVPGSQQIKKEAEREGLHEIFQKLVLNGECRVLYVFGNESDKLLNNQICASTSNRILEDREPYW